MTELGPNLENLRLLWSQHVSFWNWSRVVSRLIRVYFFSLRFIPSYSITKLKRSGGLNTPRLPPAEVQCLLWTHDYPSDKFSPSPIQPVLITRAPFDTSPPGAFGRKGSHGESVWYLGLLRAQGMALDNWTSLRGSEESDNNE